MRSYQILKTVTKVFSKFKKPNECSRKMVHSSIIDVGFFKKSIILHYLHLYNTKKRWSHLHKITFFLLALVFFSLGIMIYSKTVNISFGFYFESFILIKQGINGLCFVLSAAAFAAAKLTQPEKEALEYVTQKANQSLDFPSKEAFIEFNVAVTNLSENGELQFAEHPLHQLIENK